MFRRLNWNLRPRAVDFAALSLPNRPRASGRKSPMRTLRALLLLAATSTVAFCSPGGVLDKVTTIQVDPTFVEQPNSVKDPTAANLIRYNLRAAVKDSHLLEGSSPIRTHFVLDGFTGEGTAKRALGLGAGKTTNTVDGKLVIQDATGKQLASVKI